MPKTTEQTATFVPDLFIVPARVMLDKDLQPLDSKVYGVIYWLERLKDGRCWASNETIGKMLNASASAVSHSISRLFDKHYVIVTLDEKNHRKDIVCVINMGARYTPSSNELPPLAQTSYIDKNNKEKSYTSEMQAGIDKCYDYWLKLMVVDPAVRVHGTTDDKRAALLKAKKHTRLTPKRIASFAARIKTMGLERVLEAIKQISKSEFHRDGIQSDGTKGTWTADIEFLTRNDEQIEKWANKGGAE